MYGQFTDDARKAIQLANQAAQRFYHEYIGTEHQLIGLMKLGDEGVQGLLAQCGGGECKTCVTPDMVVAKVEELLQTGPDMVTLGKLPQTPRAKRVVELAIAEAGDGDVTPTHILLALIKESDGVASQVLQNLGFTYERLSTAKKYAWAAATFVGMSFTDPPLIQDEPAPECATCRFCQVTDPSEEDDEHGYCLRYPPNPNPPEGQHGWPVIRRHFDWCGEYEKSLTPAITE